MTTITAASPEYRKAAAAVKATEKTLDEAVAARVEAEVVIRLVTDLMRQKAEMEAIERAVITAAFEAQTL